MAKTPTSRRAQIAALALALAIPAEGLRRTAYYDPPGILTVCYGHTGGNVQKNRVYSLAECRSLLDKDMSGALDAVERCVPGLPVKVAASFADAVFNMGPTIACSSQNSTAARLLKAGQLEAACRQLPRWNKARVAGFMVPLPGLTTRRGNEMALCLEGATT
jgi:GH24 family phage-related lysozyme (muramidase)